ncbi:MAG TPA: type II toxin-antitoxin system RelE/ParE family toxin [Thermoanaerobaculia bacterium]|nr:type II toxin-antitoxin system RelE/ParE family toxin [Thermoanaerobaculia bacterium]
MSFEVLWQPSALRDLARLDRPIQQRILDAVKRLAQTGQGDVKLLHGKNPREYRLRVGGWRVRFARQEADGQMIILHVFRRGQGY